MRASPEFSTNERTFHVAKLVFSLSNDVLFFHQPFGADERIDSRFSLPFPCARIDSTLICKIKAS